MLSFSACGVSTCLSQFDCRALRRSLRVFVVCLFVCCCLLLFGGYRVCVFRVWVGLCVCVGGGGGCVWGRGVVVVVFFVVVVVFEGVGCLLLLGFFGVFCFRLFVCFHPLFERFVLYKFVIIIIIITVITIIIIIVVIILS